MLSSKKKPVFHNNKTFLFREPVTALPEHDLLVLDHYAFSIHELQQYGIYSLDTFYKNPHELAQNFSSEAIGILENHPLLKKYALGHKNKLASQKFGISMTTVDMVMVLLLEIKEKETKDSPDPRAAFLKYKASLSSDEQTKLDIYVIKVLCLAPSGRNAFSHGEALGALFQSVHSKARLPKKPERVMTFAEAMMGGNPHSPCIRTLQIFLWQFVLSFKPQAIHKLPDHVKKIAAADRYLLGTTVEESKFKKFSPTFNSISEEDESAELEPDRKLKTSKMP